VENFFVAATNEYACKVFVISFESYEITDFKNIFDKSRHPHGGAQKQFEV